MRAKLSQILRIVAILTIGIISGVGVNMVVRPTADGGAEVVVEASYSIELAEEQIPALLQTEGGEIETISAPTILKIDGSQLLDEGGLDFGRGEYHDISTPWTYRDAVLDKCIDLDGKWGAQCVDGFADFHYNYTNRWLSTCGTGAARGLWDCKEINAGDDYELITDPMSLQAGDWIVFDGGVYGHVGMALGAYNSGFIALLGENQGGRPCDGGGSAFNIVNMSLETFKGAFRPKIYIQPEPTPAPLPVSNCGRWDVKRGDTMSKIMLECENTVVYGDAMDAYAKTWYSLIIKPNQSVYDGWRSQSGVGLYADDQIEHRTK